MDRFLGALRTWSQIAGWFCFDALLILCLFLVPLGLPGNFVIIALALFGAWITEFAHYGWISIGVMLGAAIVGEILEAILGSLVAGRYGATRYGMLGAFAGGIIGAILGTMVLPIIGTFIGSLAGTALGAPLLEWSRGANREDGVRAGFGAFLGRGLATAVKLAIGISMVTFILRALH